MLNSVKAIPYSEEENEMRLIKTIIPTLILTFTLLSGPLGMTGFAQAPEMDIMEGTDQRGYEVSPTVIFDLTSQDVTEAVGYLSLPTLATVIGASMTIIPGAGHLSHSHSNGHTSYPMRPQVDFGADGTVEWAFGGEGYGRAGLQTLFKNGTGQVSLGFPVTATASSWYSDRQPYMETSFMIPRTAQVDTARLLIEPVIERDWWDTGWKKRLPFTISPMDGEAIRSFEVVKEFKLEGSPDEIDTLNITMVEGELELPIPFERLSAVGEKVTVAFTVPDIDEGRSAYFNLYYSNDLAGPTYEKGPIPPIVTYFHNEEIVDKAAPAGTGFSLSRPHGLFMTDDGNILVTDTGHHRIIEVSLSGEVIRQVGITDVYGEDNTHLDCPRDVGVDSKGQLLVTDTCNSRVQVYGPGWDYKGTIGGPKGIGDGPEELFFPWSVALDENDQVYVSDMGNRRVQVFNGPDSVTAFWTIGVTGVTGSDSRHLDCPKGIAVSDALYVSDQHNSRVQVFSDITNVLADRTLGLNKVSSPSDVAVTEDRIHIADEASDEVIVLDGDGYWIETITGLTSPNGLAIGKNGDLWISDTGNDRIVRLINAELDIGPVETLDLPRDTEVRVGDHVLHEGFPLATTEINDLGPVIEKELEGTECTTDIYGNEMCEIKLRLDGKGFTPGTTLAINGLDIRYNFTVRMSLALAAGTSSQSIPVKASSKDGGIIVLQDIVLKLDHPPSLTYSGTTDKNVSEGSRGTPILDVHEAFYDEGPLNYSITLEPAVIGAVWEFRDDGWLLLDLGNCSNTTGHLELMVNGTDIHGQAGPPLDLDIEIIDVPDPPILHPPPQVQLDLHDVLSMRLEATDGDGDRLAFYHLDGPAGLSVSGDGNVSWAPRPSDLGVNRFTIGVTDGTYDSYTTLIVNVSSENGSPTVSVPEQTSITANERLSIPVEVTHKDGDKVEIELVKHPSGMVYDEGQGLIIWVPGPDQIGTHIIILSSTDGTGTVQHLIRIEVTEPCPWIRITDGPDKINEDSISFSGQAGSLAGEVLRVEARIDNGPWKVIEGKGLWRILLTTPSIDPGIHRLQVRAFDGSFSEPASLNFPIFPVKDKATTEPVVQMDVDLLTLIIILIMVVIGGFVMLKRINGSIYCVHRSPDGPTMCVPLGDTTTEVGGLLEPEEVEHMGRPEEIPATIRCFLCLGRIKRPEDSMECPRCGRIYHRACSERVRSCPMCGSTLLGEEH